MALRSININAAGGNASVTSIDCGTSSPKLGGVIDVSAFPNLSDFRCIGHNVTEFKGMGNLKNVVTLNLSDNALTGSIPSLSVNTKLVDFYCFNNALTGSIPSLSANTALQRFYCWSCSFTGSPPALPSRVTQFRCEDNQLTGSIPNFTSNTSLNAYFCHKNQLVGDIPDLSALQSLNQFFCHNNKLSGFSGGVPTGLGKFQAQNNQLTASAVNALLAAFVAANRTSGDRILNLAGSGNAAPTGQGLTDKTTLQQRGWTLQTN